MHHQKLLTRCLAISLIVLCACVACFPLVVPTGADEPPLWACDDFEEVACVGKSHATEILMLLGDPTIKSQDGSIWVYGHYQTDFLILTPGPGTIGDSRSMVLDFDKDGILTGLTSIPPERAYGCTKSGLCIYTYWKTVLIPPLYEFTEEILIGADVFELQASDKSIAARNFTPPEEGCRLYLYAWDENPFTDVFVSRMGAATKLFKLANNKEIFVSSLSINGPFFKTAELAPGAYRIIVTDDNFIESPWAKRDIEDSLSFQCKPESNIFIRRQTSGGIFTLPRHNLKELRAAKAKRELAEYQLVTQRNMQLLPPTLP